MNHRAATGVDHVAAHGRARAHLQGGVRDVGDGQLRLGGRVGRDDNGGDRISRIVVHEVLDLRMRPRQLGTDVVDASTDLERTGDPDDASVASHARAERLVGREQVAIEERRRRTPKHGGGPGREASGADPPTVRGAEVIMQRPAEIESIIRIVAARATQHAARVAQRRREAGLGRAIDVHEVGGVGQCRRVADEKLPECAVESEPDVVLQKAHHADVESGKPDAQIEQPARTAETKLLFGNQYLGCAQIDDELVSADRERDVIRRQWRFLHFVKDRRIENDIQQGGRIERCRLGSEHWVVAQLIDRVLFEKVDQSDRHRDRELGCAGDMVFVLDGTIGGIVATDVAVTAERHASHAVAPRVERKLRAGRPQWSEHEQGERNSDDSSSHKAPRTWERPPQLCTLCPIFPLFGVRKVTQTPLQGAVWSVRVTRVPLPGSLSSVITPPQLSTRRRAIASPSPAPLDVVENVGSNTRGRTSGGIPRPSSATTSCRPLAATWTVTRFASALRAFSSRFTSTSLTSSLRASAGEGAPLLVRTSNRGAAPRS